jgi:DNA polymerase-3 subunit epsilon
MKFIVVDVETSGMSINSGGRVIEIGAVAMEQGRIVAELATLIDTGAPISYGAFLVHGISMDMLTGSPAPEAAWPYFLEFAGDAPLVAHNAPFDSAFIKNELARLGMSMKNHWHCTVRLARKKLPHLPNHRLDTVYCHLFGALPSDVQRHRALDDARLTARVWAALNNKG